MYYGTFPAGFQFGVATASYQIEGSPETRGRNIWDTFSHTKGKIEDSSTGDVACDSYNNYEVDIANVAELGMNFYRFSISWARLIPTGVLSEGVNEKGKGSIKSKKKNRTISVVNFHYKRLFLIF